MGPTPTRSKRAPRAVGTAVAVGVLAALLLLSVSPKAGAGVEAVVGAEAGLTARVRAAESVVAQRSAKLAAAIEALQEAETRRAGAEAVSARIETIETKMSALETSLAGRDDAVRDADARSRDLAAKLQHVVGELAVLGRRPDPDRRRLARLRAYAQALVRDVAGAQTGLADATAGRGAVLRRRGAIEARLAAARARQKDVLAELAALDVAVGHAADDVLERRRRREGAVRWSARLREALPGARDSDRPLIAATLRRSVTLTEDQLGQALEGWPSQNDAFVLPIEGASIEAFTAGQAPGGLDRGVRLRAGTASAVRAPQGGLIVFAGTFRHLGLLLIIDHGREYHSLLAGFSSLGVAKGDRVEAGDVVGTLAVSSPRGHDLYLELRHRGLPQDPLPWLASRQDKVRG